MRRRRRRRSRVANLSTLLSSSGKKAAAQTTGERRDFELKFTDENGGDLVGKNGLAAMKNGEKEADEEERGG